MTKEEITERVLKFYREHGTPGTYTLRGSNGISWLSDFLDWLIPELNHAEALRCAADVCVYCACPEKWGKPELDLGYFMHESKTQVFFQGIPRRLCLADIIHKRLQRESQKEKQS